MRGKVKRLFFLLLFPLFQLSCSNYQYHSEISSYGDDIISFSLSHHIDFSLEVTKTSPISQKPETLIFTFQRISSHLENNHQVIDFDTNEEKNHTINHAKLSKFINQPISIKLNNDLKIKTPIEDFEKIKALVSMEKHFFNEKFIVQICDYLLLSHCLKDSPKVPIDLEFPFSIETSAGATIESVKKTNFFNFNKDLKIEGLYPFNSESFSILLDGRVSGEGSWGDDKWLCEHFDLECKFLEASETTFFDRPLFFNGSLNIHVKPSS